MLLYHKEFIEFVILFGHMFWMINCLDDISATFKYNDRTITDQRYVLCTCTNTQFDKTIMNLAKVLDLSQNHCIRRILCSSVDDEDVDLYQFFSIRFSTSN